MTTKLDKVLYTAEAHTVGGRDGAGKSSDGAIDVKLSSPGFPSASIEQRAKQFFTLPPPSPLKESP